MYKQTFARSSALSPGAVVGFMFYNLSPGHDNRRRVICLFLNGNCAAQETINVSRGGFNLNY